MRTFLKAVFIFMLAGNAYAKAYKCEVNGKTTYQQSPCPDDGQEFKTIYDLSATDYYAAQKRLNDHNDLMAAQRKVADENREIRRQEDLDFYTLRARQSSAVADHRQANESRLRRKAVEEQNRLLREQR